MKRRGFLIGGIAASAAVRAWPFRVYSFPSQIIAVDCLAEKEKYIRLAHIHIDLQVANLGFFEPETRWALIRSTARSGFQLTMGQPVGVVM